VTGIEVGRMDTTEVGDIHSEEDRPHREYWQKTPGIISLPISTSCPSRITRNSHTPKTVHMTGYVMGGLYALARFG